MRLSKMLVLSLIILIFCKALSFLRTNLSNFFYLRISSIILLFSSFLVYNCIDLTGFIDSGIGIYGGLFEVTIMTQIIELFILLIGSLILISWPIKKQNKINNLSNIISFQNTQYENEVDVKENYLKYTINYSIIIIFSSLGASLLIASSDLISMYVCVELQSFSLYILASLFKDLENSTSAGLKYFLLGGLASCLILLGSGLVYSTIGLTNFDSISSLISNHNILNLKEFQLGIIIIFIGFLIKIAAAPLHNWSPDVYDETPSIVTIWLTIIPKLSILILLFEIFSDFNLDFLGQDLISNLMLLNVLGDNNNYIDLFLTDLGNNKLLKYLILVVSLISLITGGIVGLNQKHIKRLLAYSTISHLGFILLSLTIFTEQSIESFLFYIIQYSITNLNIFLIIIGLSYLNLNYIHNKLNNEYFLNRIKDINLISEFKGQFFLNPFISICFSICFFSLAGIPPLMGFFSKQFVLLSSLQEGYYFITLVAIIVSVISASYYLKVIKELYYESQTEYNLIENKYKLTYFEENNNNKIYSKVINIINQYSYLNNRYLLTSSHSYLVSTLTFIILLFIFKPSLILNTSLIVSLSIFNF